MTRTRFTQRLVPHLAALFATLAIAAPPALAADGTGLPGGATSLRETYQDWTVACIVKDKTKRCSFSQQQNQKNGPLVLAIELAPTAESGLSGTLLLPFGLLLAPGAKYQIDDKPGADPLPFRTCIPAGCVVPITFDAAAAKALRVGKTLKLTAVRSDNNQPFPLSIPLDGFGLAMDRTSALVK